MIELTHVQKVVEQTTLLEIESLEVLSGTTAAVVGLTGQAKNMLLELLNGRSQPTAGTIQIAGLNPAQNQSAIAQIMGVLPPENNLYPRLTVRRNLVFYCDLYGLAAGRADEILHQVGLTDRAQTKAEDLPPEMARRLAFGRAILHAPPLLILVDPFVDCTAATIDLLTRLCQNLQEKGTTLLFIATQTKGLPPLCETIHLFEDGKLADSYDPQAEKNDQNMPFKIPARLDGKVALINPGDILYAAAEDSKTVLCTENGRIPTHLTLNEVEQRLARSGFFRAHRSYLVTLQHVTEVIAYTRTSYTLILEDSSEIPLSKSAARDLRALLDY
jgi:ABC-2 type transport system ATP-binding protein